MVTLTIKVFRSNRTCADENRGIVERSPVCNMHARQKRQDNSLLVILIGMGRYQFALLKPKKLKKANALLKANLKVIMCVWMLLLRIFGLKGVRVR